MENMETTNEIIVAPEQNKIRIDVYLAETFKSHSRSTIKKMIENGQVLVDGKVIKPGYRLKTGEKIYFDNSVVLEEVEIKPEPIKLSVVYEDEDLLVVDKPAGMVVHPACGNWTGTLVNALLFYSKNLSDIGGPFRVGIVHRLDKDTSGLLIVAKNNAAHKKLAVQFANKTIVRRYVGFVSGVIEQDAGVIDAPVGRSAFNRKLMIVSHDPGKSKSAQTKFFVKQRYKNFTVVDIEPKTGRTHQIRIHMAHIGHPILGDAQYGHRMLLQRQALHAAFLRFRHPVTKEYIEVNAPIPSDMKMFLRNAEKQI